MDFEWDEAKNAANIAKHGIGFALASRIFEGPVVTWMDDRQDYGEVRERSIGVVDDILFLTVIHTDRNGRGGSYLRVGPNGRKGRTMKPRYDKELSIAELAAMGDEDIDVSDIPEADEAFWQNARVHMPDRAKTPLNMRLDADVVEWFRSQGKGYQTRINAVLRSFYEAHKQPPSGKPR